MGDVRFIKIKSGLVQKLLLYKSGGANKRGAHIPAGQTVCRAGERLSHESRARVYLLTIMELANLFRR